MNERSSSDSPSNEHNVFPHMNDPPARGFRFLDFEEDFKEILDEICSHYIPAANFWSNDMDQAKLMELKICHRDNVAKFEKLNEEQQEKWRNLPGYGVVWGVTSSVFHIVYKGMDKGSVAYQIAAGLYKSKKKRATKTTRSELAKYRKIERNRMLHFSNPLLLQNTTYDYPDSIEDVEQRKYFQMLMTPDPKYGAGIIIVDGLKVSLKMFQHILRQKAPDTIRLIKKIRRMTKGGFKITTDPSDGDKVAGGIMCINQFGEQELNQYNLTSIPTISVHPPSALSRGEDRSVIAYNVQHDITDEELMASIVPPVVGVRRFTNRSGEPTTTVKLTFVSKAMAEAVKSRKAVMFQHAFIAISGLRDKNKGAICRTCKRLKTKCPNGYSCDEIRCARCGGSHVTRECKKQLKVLTCLHCHSEGHLVYHCPEVQHESKKQKVLRLKARRQEKARLDRKRKQYMVEARGNLSYADAARRSSSQRKQVKQPRMDALGISQDEMMSIVVESYVQEKFGALIEPEYMDGTIRRVKARFLEIIHSRGSHDSHNVVDRQIREFEEAPEASHHRDLEEKQHSNDLEPESDNQAQEHEQEENKMALDADIPVGSIPKTKPRRRRKKKDKYVQMTLTGGKVGPESPRVKEIPYLRAIAEQGRLKKNQFFRCACGYSGTVGDSFNHDAICKQAVNGMVALRTRQ